MRHEVPCAKRSLTSANLADDAIQSGFVSCACLDMHGKVSISTDSPRCSRETTNVWSSVEEEQSMTAASKIIQLVFAVLVKH